MKVFTIARLTFLEARQRRLLWIVSLLGLALLLLYAVGFFFMYRDFSVSGIMTENAFFQGSNTLAIMGFYAVNFLSIMMTVVVSVDTLAGEVASGTIHTIVTKPLRRWEVVLGKWLGFAAMLSVFVGAMSGGVIAITWLITRTTIPNAIHGILLMILGVLVILTLSILGSTRLSTLANGVCVLMVYGLAFIAGWIEQFGAFAHNATAVNLGIVVSLLVPAESMWKRAAYLMQPPALRELGLSPFGTASSPSSAMVIYAGVYTLIALFVAMRSFHTRDL